MPALQRVEDQAVMRATGYYGDMIEMDILDPTRVTRLALRNAGSIAGRQHGGMGGMGV